MSAITKFFLYCIPFVPLYVTRETIFPFIVGKNMMFRILVELSLIFWLAGKPKIRDSYILISVLTFTFIIGLAGVFGVYTFGSFWSSLERMSGYITTLHLAAFFMLLSMFNKKDWKIFMTVFALVSMIVGWNALPDYMGTVGNRAFLAGYLMLAIVMKAILATRSKLWFVYIAAIIFDLYIIWGTGIRGCILGLMAGAVAYHFMITKDKRKHLGLLIVSVLLLFSVLYFANGVLRNVDLVKNNHTLSKIVNVRDSATVRFRILLWDMMWKGFKDRPWLGWGQEGQKAVYYRYINQEIALLEKPADRAHNIFLDILITSGLFGLMSYLSIWVFTMLKLFKHNIWSYDRISIMLISGLTAYFVQNMFVFDTIVTSIGFYSLLAYIDGREKEEPTKYQRRKGRRKKQRFAFCDGHY